MEAEQKKLGDELDKELAQIPNMPADDVPDGTDATAMSSIASMAPSATTAFKPKQHFELGEALGMMDFELAAKLSGARFVVLQKGLARMERALGQFFLDVHTSEKHGYTEVNPPLLVRDDVMFGTAQLPKFDEDQFDTIIRHVRANSIYKIGREYSNSLADQISCSDENTKKTFDETRSHHPSANASITFSAQIRISSKHYTWR